MTTSAIGSAAPLTGAEAGDTTRRSAATPWDVNAQIELEYESERNFDLDSGENENEATLEPELDLEIAYRPSQLFQGFVRLELLREYGVSGPEAETEHTKLDLAEAYLASEGIAAPVGGKLSLYAGRRLFADERQWLYDEQLDGLTLRYEYDALSLSLSAVRERDQDLLNERHVDEPINYIAYGRYRFDDQVLGAYVFKQRAQDGSDEHPLFIGLQSAGDFGSAADYWLELAMVRGHDRGNSIHGWGLDTGLTWHFDAPLSPSLILGYAYGSGDGDAADGVNNAFRQTGLQDNEQDLGGLASFHYLGLALDPELSNLRVLTAGVGLRPHEQISTKLLLHHYRQDYASPDLTDINLDADPNGADPDLGYAIDWVTGIEVGDAIEIETKVGYFHPRAAFDDYSDSALYLGTEIEYEF